MEQATALSHAVKKTSHDSFCCVECIVCLYVMRDRFVRPKFKLGWFTVWKFFLFFFSIYFVSCSGPCALKEKWHRKEHIVIIIMNKSPLVTSAWWSQEIPWTTFSQWIFSSSIHTSCINALPFGLHFCFHCQSWSSGVTVELVKDEEDSASDMGFFHQ